MPTLKDLYLELKRQPQPEAQNLALTWNDLRLGNAGLFLAYDKYKFSNRLHLQIKDIGNGMKTMGLQICLDNIWNKMIDNYQKRKKNLVIL